MARKVRAVGGDIVVLQQASVDLGDAAGKVALNIRVPGDGARIMDFKLISTTAGTGNFTHSVTVERVSGNTDLTAVAALDADLAAETSTAEANGLTVQPYLTWGEAIQLDNVETGGDITNGAIVTVIIRWIL